jgi:hypothetical protein
LFQQTGPILVYPARLPGAPAFIHPPLAFLLAGANGLQPFSFRASPAITISAHHICTVTTRCAVTNNVALGGCGQRLLAMRAVVPSGWH